ncbi:MAG TPA: Ger(x)C family spore germination protein [Thermoclostridium caenicola]|nr:Ger(x)C family spore germination protein [Thermoclostridium caenicola]
MVLLAFLLACLLLLSGCWNYKELTDINVVVGVGLDRTEEGKVLLTVQVAEPGSIQSTSGHRSGGEGPTKPVFVVSHEGETIFGAIREMLATVDKKLFFSTAQVLILSERLARESLEESLDFFQRDHEVDYLMNVLVAKDVSPAEILAMESDMDTIPAVYISETVENTSYRGTGKKTMLIDVIKDMDCKGKQPVIGQITKAGENMVRTEGIAVFKEGKLVGWLDPYETRGYQFAMNDIGSAIVNIPAEEGKMSMEVFRSKAKIGVEFEDGEPACLMVKVRLEANVGGHEGKGKLDAPEKISALEEILEETIRKEIAMALEKAQDEYSSDIFGFGMEVHKYHPQYWKKAQDEWDRIFSRLPADIQVDAKIRRTGIIINPVIKEH